MVLLAQARHSQKELFFYAVVPADSGMIVAVELAIEAKIV
jgi:hypothetical protein